MCRKCCLATSVKPVRSTPLSSLMAGDPSWANGDRPSTQIRCWASISGRTCANGLSVPWKLPACRGETAIAKSLTLLKSAG